MAPTWYISGVPDERWDNDDLHTLGQVLGSNFEAVDEASLYRVPNFRPQSVVCGAAHRVGATSSENRA